MVINGASDEVKSYLNGCGVSVCMCIDRSVKRCRCDAAQQENAKYFCCFISAGSESATDAVALLQALAALSDELPRHLPDLDLPKMAPTVSRP